MTEFIPANDFDETTLQDRIELFRYTDLTQPLMQVLFPLQLPAPTENEAD